MSCYEQARPLGFCFALLHFVFSNACQGASACAAEKYEENRENTRANCDRNKERTIETGTEAEIETETEQREVKNQRARCLERETKIYMEGKQISTTCLCLLLFK